MVDYSEVFLVSLTCWVIEVLPSALLEKLTSELLEIGGACVWTAVSITNSFQRNRSSLAALEIFVSECFRRFDTTVPALDSRSSSRFRFMCLNLSITRSALEAFKSSSFEYFSTKLKIWLNIYNINFTYETKRVARSARVSSLIIAYPILKWYMKRMETYCFLFDLPCSELRLLPNRFLKSKSSPKKINNLTVLIFITFSRSFIASSSSTARFFFWLCKGEVILLICNSQWAQLIPYHRVACFYVLPSFCWLSLPYFHSAAFSS